MKKFPEQYLWSGCANLRGGHFRLGKKIMKTAIYAVKNVLRTFSYGFFGVRCYFTLPNNIFFPLYRTFLPFVARKQHKCSNFKRNCAIFDQITRIFDRYSRASSFCITIILEVPLYGYWCPLSLMVPFLSTKRRFNYWYMRTKAPCASKQLSFVARYCLCDIIRVFDKLSMFSPMEEATIEILSPSLGAVVVLWGRCPVTTILTKRRISYNEIILFF